MGESRREMTPEELAARRALRELPDVEADSAFRDQLRAQFLEGASATSRASSARTRRSRSPRAPVARTRPRVLWIGGALAAAAVVVLMLLFQGDTTPRWELHFAEAGAEITVDGQAISLADLDTVSERLKAGSSVATTSAGVTLRAGDSMLLALSPDTELTLPGPLGQGVADVKVGEIRLVSGPDFQGPLTLQTREARIDVVGTSLAVLHGPMGTCVCVLDGEVQMTNRLDQEQRRVAKEQRWLVPHDGKAGDVDGVMEEHGKSLQLLHDEAQSVWK